MRKRLLFPLLIILAVTLGIFHYAMKEEPTGKEFERMQESYKKRSEWIGKMPPNFEIEFLNGEKFDLSENIGNKIIILNFFATWCGPCREEMPELNYFYKSHENEPFLLIGITSEEDKDLIEKFVTEQRIDFPVGIDKNSKISEKYDIEGVPTTVFIGAEGRIGLYEVGAIANADVAFQVYYQVNLRMIESNSGISKEEYISKLQLQEKIAKIKRKEKIDHKDRIVELSERIICPSCDRPLIDCHEEMSMSLKKKLVQIELEDKSDEEILKELFLADLEDHD